MLASAVGLVAIPSDNSRGRIRLMFNIMAVLITLDAGDSSTMIDRGRIAGFMAS